MRTDRYREVAGQLHVLLGNYASQVEKASYDDFYLDVTNRLLQRLPSPATDSELARVRILGGGGQGGGGICRLLTSVPELLQAAASLAIEIQCRVREQMHMSVSIGVAVSKLQARLISSLSKPAGITLLPPDHISQFMKDVPLRSIPTLRGKGGAAICDALAISTVGDLSHVSPQILVARFGSKLASFLTALPGGGPNDDPRDRGRAKAVLAERSCPPTTDPTVVRQLLGVLAVKLAQRLVEECSVHARLPSRLTLSWRTNYENMRSKTGALPGQLSSALVCRRRVHPLSMCAAGDAACLAKSTGKGHFVGNSGVGLRGRNNGEGEEDTEHVRMGKWLEDAGMQLLHSARVTQPLTRLALSCSMTDDALTTGQSSINCFLSTSQAGVAKVGASANAPASNPVAQECPQHPSKTSSETGQETCSGLCSTVVTLQAHSSASAHTLVSPGQRVGGAASMRAAFGWHTSQASEAAAVDDARRTLALDTLGEAVADAALHCDSSDADILAPRLPAHTNSTGGEQYPGGGAGSTCSLHVYCDKGGGPHRVYAAGLASLAEMGFCDSEAALEALRTSKGSVSAAIQLLVNDATVASSSSSSPHTAISSTKATRGGSELVGETAGRRSKLAGSSKFAGGGRGGQKAQQRGIASFFSKPKDLS